MIGLLAMLESHAARRPDQPAIVDGGATIGYRELLRTVTRLSRRLQRIAPRAVALAADNGAAWAVADLAAMIAGIPLVPIPAFFTTRQVQHALTAAGVDLILVDDIGRIEAASASFGPQHPRPFCDGLRSVRLSQPAVARLPAGTIKVTFTSGTTGTPKGVCLVAEQLDEVVLSLMHASGGSPTDRHLCLLPLATLLENVAGLYVPLMAGATTCVPPLAAVGLEGSSRLDVVQMVSALTCWRATTAITVPQTLNALTQAARAGIAMPRALRYLAVGGAPIALHALEAARGAGLPVHEGYGLSECASVVAVNRPGDDRPGSVGRPLGHATIRLAADGEILVDAVRWHGYLGDPPTGRERRTVATGDLGCFDADGFLYVTGRKRDVFITAFGRNVAPEWVEGELRAVRPILQAAVFGEGRPFNSAVLVVAPDATADAVDAALTEVNDRLPDYAQIRAWTRADAPFSPTNGMLTFNGRLRRESVLGAYATRLDALYQSAAPSRSRAVPRPAAVRHAR